MPGAFNLKGKSDFDEEIGNDAFSGSPIVKITRLTEENDVVISEGTISSTPRDGRLFSELFCDVFEMENTIIKRLITYLVQINE